MESAYHAGLDLERGGYVYLALTLASDTLTKIFGNFY